jgi:cytoskeleton-associated protein 5
MEKISVLIRHREDYVRQEGRLMVTEIYRWIGNAVKQHLDTLQPIQVSAI